MLQKISADGGAVQEINAAIDLGYTEVGADVKPRASVESRSLRTKLFLDDDNPHAICRMGGNTLLGDAVGGRTVQQLQ